MCRGEETILSPKQVCMIGPSDTSRNEMGTISLFITVACETVNVSTLSACNNQIGCQ